VLVGDELWSYTDVWAYVKGDPPTVSCICFFEEMGGTTTTTTTRERERDLLIGGFDV
jgi:hypothetical protein